MKESLNSNSLNNKMYGHNLVTITLGAPVAQGIERLTPDQ